jgi:Esterase/lipase
MKKLLLFLMTTTGFMYCHAQTVLPLYDGEIPNSKPGANQESSETDQKGITRISKVSQPTLTVYQPPKEKATGAAVIVLPGGGYRILAYNHEGTEVAKRFNEMGVTAFLLKYRLPSNETMIHKEIGPIQDAQRAIQLVREKAEEYGIDKNRVGIIGLSAGGHLASTAGTHFNRPYINVPRRTNLRPDFMILVYR